MRDKHQLLLGIAAAACIAALGAAAMVYAADDGDGPSADNPGQWVGALVVGVPIRSSDDRR